MAAGVAKIDWAEPLNDVNVGVEPERPWLLKGLFEDDHKIEADHDVCEVYDGPDALLHVEVLHPNDSIDYDWVAEKGEDILDEVEKGPTVLLHAKDQIDT